jgi:hypothetical protein
MEVFHRISLDSRMDAKLLTVLDRHGVKYKKRALGKDLKRKSEFIYFDITESDPHWKYVAEFIQDPKNDIPDRYDTFFSDDEILKANWLRVIPTFEHGYPQPEKTWIKNPINYNNYCAKCGVHRQVLPFHIKDEPNMRGNNFMSLVWTWTFFATQNAIVKLLAKNIKGFETWNLILHKPGLAASMVSQIFPIGTAMPGLLCSEELSPEICSACGTTKYHYHNRGELKYKKDSIDRCIDILYLNEWFGAGGASAYKEILVSNRFAKIVTENRWKGIRFKTINLED